MRELLTAIVILSISSLSSNCNNFVSRNTDSVYMDYNYKKLGYKLFSPAKKHFLNYDLEEISGLAYYKDDQVAAVEDEDGELYFINVNSGKIERRIDFGKSGDYEGVEIIGNDVYILRSDGDIFNFTISDSDKVEAEKTETILESSNDAEGLGQHNGMLMIALKGSEDTNENKAHGKAIYSYNVNEKVLIEKELFDFDQESLTAFIEKRKYFKKVNDFDPSAIASHPITKDIYVLSADKILAVFSPSFELKEVVRLNPITYNQAEGLCFAPNGTMYISSEGDGGKGKIMIIDYDH